MYRNYYSNKDERFIGPLLPFIGGALVGYVVGRPNLGYYQQPYYPVYYQYPTYPYYQTNYYQTTPYTYN